jgi:chitodextrinase
MIFFNKLIPLLCVSLLLSLGSESVLAQGKSSNAHGRLYGIGKPKSTQDLPPGKLRKDLEGLPAKAKGKALDWLQGFSFPPEDIEYLRVNSDGAIYYADTFLPSRADGASAEVVAGAATAAASQVFQLHSRPGASNVVFLDFDGHTIEGAAWNDKNVLFALPFDPSVNDNPPTTANFTQDELNRIFEIWHRISEDFAAFNIDVTTEEPAVFTATTGHVLFTHDTDASGQAMPSRGAGGVAWINVFGRHDYATKFSPALVYYTNLYTSLYGYPTLNAEAGSHEFGHNIGLGHDGIIDGTTYYKGHGSGLVDWSPIMGNSYSRNVTQWSQGDYPNANNPEDDLAIIAGDLGHVGDDHGNSAAQATALLVEANGDILVSSPELDPDNVLPENKGVIDDRNDVDWFFVDADSGPLTITATPAWHSFTRTDLRGSNLDIELTLYDSGLVQLDIDEPENDSKAAVSATVAAGRYYLQVDGVGNNTISSYDDYASMGMYFLEGSIQPVVIEVDITPPSPATMAWQAVPYATGTTSISMSAVQATDDSGPIEYYFSCVAGGSGCSNSGWQSSRTHSATGLAEGTSYSYKVRARDSLGNENEYSVTLAASTELAPPPPDSAPSSLIANAISASAIDLTWLDNASNESSYEIQRSPDGDDWADLASAAANAESYTDNELSSDTTYYYRVFARNNEGDSEPSNEAHAHTADDSEIIFRNGFGD